MNTENVFASQSDDVVFDNRNKMYGAYSIRKSYASSLTKGSGGSLLAVGLFIAAVQAILMIKPDLVNPIGDCHLPVKLDNDFIVIPDPPAPPPKQEVKPAQGFPTTVVSYEVPETPPVETNVPATAGETTEVGNPGPATEVGVSIEVSTTPVVVEPPKTVDRAEIMPEFEGGEQAMHRFLQRHLRYPHTDQEGTVYIRFVIDITGTVTGIEVIRGVSGLLDREASRVIALMPKWKPGAQHGAPVNVRMVLPIKFVKE